MEDDNEKGDKNLRNYKTKHAYAFSRRKKSKGKVSSSRKIEQGK